MRLLILTNILTPYRCYFFDKLNDYIKSIGGELKIVVMSETEPNRNWHYQNFIRDYTELVLSRSYNIKGDIFIHIHLKNHCERILKEFKPSHVIVGGSYLNPIIIFLKKKKNIFNYKLLFWSESHLDEVKGFLRKQMIRKFDDFCVPGLLAKDFIKKYNKKANFYYIPNLVEEEYYSLAFYERKEKKREILKKYNLDESFIFLLPARLAPVKGILEFLDIYRKARNRDESIVLIAGSGELESEIKIKCEQNKLNVQLLGTKNKAEMKELYTIADCLVLPSLSDPNPLSCIEALWAGLSLLVSNHVGNYPEVIKEGENGFIFSYTDIEDAIMKVERLISPDLHFKKNSSMISREIAESYFNSEIAIMNFINQLKN